jgi:hypothetical protein
VVTQGSPAVLPALLGLGVLVSHPICPPRTEGALGLAPVSLAKPGCSPLLARSAPRDGMHPFDLHGRHAFRARSSRRECAAVYPLGCCSHSGQMFNVGLVAMAVNPGGAPSVARKDKFRSSSGCRNSGVPSRPRAACSIPCKAGQSWWPLLTGDGGDLSRPVPGVRLVPSRPAALFGEGGTVALRKMVPPRVWNPMRASCLPSTASRVKSRPDAMAGFSARSCVTSYRANFQVSRFSPRGEDRGAIITPRK